jgi:transposase
VTASATTYRFRLRDKHARELARQARACNWVWNFCRETHAHALLWGKRWPTAFDLSNLCAGSCKELGLLSSTIDRICQQYVQSRERHCRPLLRWRGKKSLGWIPLRDGVVRFDGTGFVYRGARLEAWVSRQIPAGHLFRSGSISQDARGRWYINLLIDSDAPKSAGTSPVGVDLGVKDIATLSTGRKIDHPRWYRAIEQRLAVAQRARKKKRVTSLHLKAAHQRADFLHKESLRIVQEHGAVFVGNVSPSAIAKTGRGKSSLDAGWAMFKRNLEYKALARGVLFAEVNEAYSTQTCSQCGSIEGPKGFAGLGIRRWACGCGAEHDRDTNAAMNIARRGLATLAEGASSRRSQPKTGVAKRTGAPTP